MKPLRSWERMAGTGSSSEGLEKGTIADEVDPPVGVAADSYMPFFPSARGGIAWRTSHALGTALAMPGGLMKVLSSYHEVHRGRALVASDLSVSE